MAKKTVPGKMQSRPMNNTSAPKPRAKLFNGNMATTLSTSISSWNKKV